MLRYIKKEDTKAGMIYDKKEMRYIEDKEAVSILNKLSDELEIEGGTSGRWGRRALKFSIENTRLKEMQEKNFAEIRKLRKMIK